MNFKKLHSYEFLIKSLGEYMCDVQLLVEEGNPRLIHMLVEIIMQKNSLDDWEENVLLLLDQLTSLYLGMDGVHVRPTAKNI